MYTRTSLRQIRSLNVLNDISFYPLYIAMHCDNDGIWCDLCSVTDPGVKPGL